MAGSARRADHADDVQDQVLGGYPGAARPDAEPKAYAGFALPGDRQPDFIRQLDAQMHVETSINFSNYLTLDQEVPLDGSIVLDLRYF